MQSHFVRTLAAVLVFAGPASAQAERYELGRRLKQFEKAWDETTDEAKRKAALAILPDATAKFFSLQLGEAGRTLDEARFALQKEPPADAVRWATALYAVPERRLLDAATTELKVEVRAFYKVSGGVPDDVVAYTWLRYAKVDGRKTKVPLGKFPVTVSVPVRGPLEGSEDHQLFFETWITDARPLTIQQSTVSVVKDLDARLAAIRKAAESKPPSLEAATLKERAELLAELAAGDVPETDHPAARWFDQAAQLAAGDFFRPVNRGDQWMAVPLEKKKTVPCRLLVPKELAADKPVPLVVALHGAGASENMFFEGYGNGRVVKECEKRGWLLVAPRAGFGAPPVAAVIDKLAERYPVDRKRVFVVGHSMGAGHAVALCQSNPGLFAGAAMLGGGGRVGDAKPFTGLPTFVGVGDKDFALNGARALAKSLTGTPTTLKEYPGVEHLAIVGVALPDVFAAWDAIAK